MQGARPALGLVRRGGQRSMLAVYSVGLKAPKAAKAAFALDWCAAAARDMLARGDLRGSGGGSSSSSSNNNNNNISSINSERQSN